MNFDLKRHAHLITLGGSRAYNTHTNASDVDIKGVAIAPRAIRDGFLHSFEQADKKEHARLWLPYLPDEVRVAATYNGLEGAIYDLRKFMSLAADCNPNILDVLFADEEDVVFATEIGHELRLNAQDFLSKKALYTFRGYAIAQLKRIQIHRKWLLDPPTKQPDRKDFGLAVLPTIPTAQREGALEAIKRRIDGWSIDYGTLDEAGKIFIEEQLAAYLADLECSADDKWTRAGRLLGMGDDLLDELRKERQFAEAQSHWEKYNQWQKGRNPARAALEAEHGYDTKHGMHLVRLMTMCREILVEGTVRVKRPDAAFLQSIRNGAWSYERLLAWSEQQDSELVALAKTSPLPHSPDRVTLNNLCVELTNRADKGASK